MQRAGGFRPPAYTYPDAGLAGFGAHKPLDRLIGSAATWHNALTALRDANEIYVIGWSASPYGNFARFHFASVLAIRDKPLNRVVVVDPKVHQQFQNYRAIFREVEPIAKKVEELKQLDWQRLFAGRSDERRCGE